MLLHSFPKTGVILRPGFIYGTRAVGNISVPLGLVGKPMETVLRLPPFPTLQSNLPFMKAVLVPPIKVEAVGAVAAAAAMGETPSGILNVDDINRVYKSLS